LPKITKNLACRRLQIIWLISSTYARSQGIRLYLENFTHLVAVTSGMG